MLVFMVTVLGTLSNMLSNNDNHGGHFYSALFVQDKHTALYKINKNVYIKPKTFDVKMNSRVIRGKDHCGVKRQSEIIICKTTCYSTNYGPCAGGALSKPPFSGSWNVFV